MLRGGITMKQFPELYACVWMSDFPIQALHRLRPDLRNEPCVVMDGESPLQRVNSLNDKARLKQATIGMTRVEVDTLPMVNILPRSQREEQSAKALLLECAWEFSPRIEEVNASDSYLMVIDIAGTEKLWGSPDSLISALKNSIASFSIDCSIAVCSNYHASILLARSLARSNSTVAIPAGHIRQSLAPISLSVLDLTEDHTQLFQLWGIHSLGMLAELPELEIIARLGQEGKRLLQLAKGTRQHYFRPVAPGFDLAESLELDTPVFLLDSLLFVIGTLLDQLILRVTQRILAIRSVTITLTLEGGANFGRTINPALPTNDRALWIKLIYLDLETHPPNASILAVHLEAIPGVTSSIQRGLFAPQSPEPDRLDVTMARIRAIVGEDGVGCPCLQDSYRTDAFQIDDFHALPEICREICPAPHRLCMRQLRPPDPIEVTLSQHIPARFLFRNISYRIDHAFGPWTKSGDWWTSFQWNMDQWDIVASSMGGSRLYCCLTHHHDGNRWLMSALYD